MRPGSSPCSCPCCSWPCSASSTLAAWTRRASPCSECSAPAALRCGFPQVVPPDSARLLPAVPCRLCVRAPLRLPARCPYPLRLGPSHRWRRSLVALPDDGGSVDRLWRRLSSPLTGPSGACRAGGVCNPCMPCLRAAAQLVVLALRRRDVIDPLVEPGAALAHNLVRFLLFDASTSLGFDLPRAALNAGLLLVAGHPVLAALRRASHRAAFGAPVEVAPRGLDAPTSS